MTEHMPQPESFSGKTRTATKHVTINGLPSETAFSDKARSLSFDVDVHEPILSGDVNLEGSSTEAFPGINVPPTFDVNKRAGTKAEFADQKASMIGGQAVEEDAVFPGVQRQESTPITTRAEAKQRKYSARHGDHEPRHKSEASFTAEQLQAAREHLRRVMGTVAVVKDEVLATQDLHAGDNGDNEIYVGRHRKQGERRSERKNPRTNRLKRGAYRLAEIFDKKLHDYYEGHIPEYQPAESDDTAEVSAVAEASIVRRTALEGDEVMFDGNKRTVEILDEDEATIQRENEDGEIEIEAISREDLNRLLDTTATPEADDTQELDAESDEEDESDAEYRSKLQKLRDLPLLLAAKMATRRHMKNEPLTEEQKDDRRRYRNLLILGAGATATVVAAVLANKYGHDLSSGASGHGTGEGLKHLPLNDGSGHEVVFSHAAEHIGRGEGINQTMKELGIPSKYWHETLQKAGPKLVKMGLAYRDNKIGGFGWSKPGTAPKAGLRLLTDTYKSFK